MAPISSTPKYRQLANRLEEDIQAGVLPVGHRLPGERLLAARYGMSHMTVNKAIASLVERGLLRREEGRGTLVADPAGSGADICSRYVGLMVEADPHLAPPFMPVLPQALMASNRVGLVVDLNHPEFAGEQVSQLAAEGVPAFIIDGFSRFPFHALDALPRLPRLIFMHRFEGPTRYPAAYVLLDYREIGRMAVRQLLANGRRRIGLIGFRRQPRWTSQLFYEGAIAMLAEAGLQLAGEWLTDDLTPSGIAHILTTAGLDGIASVNDYRLEPFIAAASELGVSIPDDVAIIGFGDGPRSEAYGITVITHAAAELAEAAVDLLDTTDTPEICIQPRLISRRTCPAVDIYSQLSPPLPDSTRSTP